ncbi:NAD(P)/FAD-dependent oxidoreductase [Natronomonas sp. LN261]|uniref:NAD(P)/FAD-dependent oxidoreductase n=1 Tax=Natronomonas sp. LN261 TaxID=2750669 RepID=UPI0015EF55E6|nr:NAD(P)/FAD-dependent oxidoreductase [Natronomonas sp. LN261]
MKPNEARVAVLGGAVAGLAAAHGLVDAEGITEIRVFERQEYDTKRVDCGEAINDATLVPLEKTAENGFLNDVEGFQLRVYSGRDREFDDPPLETSDLRCDPGYVCDRNTVERQWARSLAEDGVAFETGRSVSPDEYRRIVEAYDYVVDATGQPSLTHKATDAVDEYTGDMVALNATVDGEFGEYLRYPRIFFEGYVGYSWSFPKSERTANVGIGWAGDRRPDDYMNAFEAAARRNGFPVPDRSDVNVYTIPRGPSLDPRRTHRPADGVFLVGDAAGIANRYQGEGICQAIWSSYLLAESIEAGRVSEYPERLFEAMRPEYRLAHLMRGAWVEHEDPELLAAVAKSLEGLSIDDVTRRPRRVFRRIVRNPTVAGRLVADSGMLRRIVDSYTDTWEYAR